MKKLLILIFLLCSLSAFSQANLFSAGECITAAPPAFNPGARGCRTVLDTSTMHYWIWNVIPGWVRQEKAADPIVGCSAPLYTPTKWQSDRAINGCSPIPLEYKHVGAGVWECMNCASATVYTAGTGIAISGGNVISNTGDLSNTNEIQRIDTLSLSGNTLSASLLSDGVPASTVDLSSLTPSTEAIQDIAGGMVTGNVESLIAVTYDDAGGKIDFAVQPNLSNYTNDVPFLVTAVTSVGLDLPAELTEAGTPVTTTGTLSATWASQAANLVFRSGNAGGTPSFSALTAADISTLLPVANNGLSDNENGGNFRLGNRYMNGSDGLFSFDRKVNLNAFKFHMGDNTDSSLLVIDGTNDRIGIGTAAPSGKLHIGTGTNVGDFTTPAIILGTANNGIYVDIDRLFFKGGNLFGGGFAAGFFIGNGIAINTGATGGANNNLITPKFMPYRLSAAGLDAGLGGNAAGDISIVTSDLARVAVLAGGNVGMGTETPDRLLHAESSDAVTNAVTYAQRLSHITSGTATTGFGLGQEVELENGSGTNRVAATQEVTWSDAVDATEDADYNLKLIRAGTLTNAFTVLSTGNVGIGQTVPTSKLHISVGDGTDYDILASDAQAGIGPTLFLEQTTGSDNNNLSQIVFRPRGAVGAFSRIVSSGGSDPFLAFGHYDLVGVEAMRVLANGKVGIGTTSPTAVLHLKAGTATANTAPLKLTTGTNLTTAEAGAVEYNNSFYATKNSGLRFGVGGVIFKSSTTVPNVTTTETDLYSHTLPASTFAADNESVEAMFSVSTLGSATATTQNRLYFAGTLVYDSGAIGFSLASDFRYTVEVIRESSTVVKISVTAATTSASAAPYTVYTRITGLTLSNTQILKITGTRAGVGAASADINGTMSTVKWFPAAG